MRYFRRYITSILCMCLILVPAVAFGQVSLDSTNHQFVDVAIGDIFVLQNNEVTVAPVISSTGPLVTEIKANEATITWTTDKLSTSTVQYGTTNAYGSETGSSLRTLLHTVTVFGLLSETTYHFKVVSLDANGSRAESVDKTFTTTAEAGIKSIKITDITYDSALLNFETADFSRYTIQIGTSTAYGRLVTSPSSAFTTKHTVKLETLSAGTEYHLRIKVQNEKGGEALSSDFTFTTTFLPAIESINVKPDSANKVTMVVKSNTPTSKVIYYRQSDASAEVKELSVANSDYSAETNLPIGGLIGETRYDYRVVITDQGGKQGERKDQSFVTPKDTIPPEITDLQVTTSRTSDKITFIATWKTNEPAKGSVSITRKGRNEQPLELPGTDVLTNTHTVVGTELKPSTLYTMTAQAVDSAGNQGTKDITFRTPKATQSIFALLAANFASAFGWLFALVKKFQ